MIEYNKIFYFSNLIFYIKKIPLLNILKKNIIKLKINKKIKKINNSKKNIKKQFFLFLQKLRIFFIIFPCQLKEKKVKK